MRCSDYRAVMSKEDASTLSNGCVDCAAMRQELNRVNDAWTKLAYQHKRFVEFVSEWHSALKRMMKKRGTF